MKNLLLVCCMLASSVLYSQSWQPDLGNGFFKNPIIFADYSDPDVIRVGDDFFLTASSFNCMPGLPVLYSKDLVNWKIVNHVYDSLPLEKYDKPVHGEGSWAPALRYSEGKYYVYFCTPRDGLFMATASDPHGKWNLELIEKVEMWEDPCPLWDNDGSAYLVRSKVCGNELFLHKMSGDGRKLLDNGVSIFKDESQPTIEGPKFLKKDGYYYILAPAGGVPQAGRRSFVQEISMDLMNPKRFFTRAIRKSMAHTRVASSNWSPANGGLYTSRTGICTDVLFICNR